MTFALQAFLQDIPKKIEKYVVQYNADSTFVLTQKGKKTGLYNLVTNTYDIKPKKSLIHLYKHRVDVVFFQDGKAVRYKCANGVLDYVCNSEDDSLLCTDFQQLYNGDFALSLFEYPVMKSIKDNTAIPDLTNNVQSSGIYNLKKNEWKISNEYMKIYEFENRIFAIKADSVLIDPEDDWQTLKFTYDIYEIEEKQYKLVQTIPANKLDHLQILYDWELVKETIVGGVYIVKRKGKYGLLFSELNHQSIRDDSRLNFYFFLDCQYDIIFEPYPEVYLVGDRASNNFELFYFKDFFTGLQKADYQFNENQVYFLPNDQWGVKTIYSQMMGDSIDVEETLFESFGDGSSQGIYQINDSLFKIVNNNFGRKEALVDSQGYDSINAEGNVVYDRVGFETATGIYNPYSDSWVIPPSYANAHFASDHYVVMESFIGENNEQPSAISSTYVILDKDLKTVESQIEIDKFYAEPEYFKYLFPLETYKEIQKMDIYSSAHKPGWLPQASYQCIHSNGKMDLVIPRSYGMTPYVLRENVDFGIIEPLSGAVLVVNEDSVIYQYQDQSYTTSKEDQIFWEYSLAPDSTKAKLYSIEDKDTILRLCHAESGFNSLDCQIQIEVSFVEEKLIFNYCPIIYRGIFGVYEEYLGRSVEELEGSAIWQKAELGYRQQTTNYAWIEPFENGFLARTRNYTGSMKYVEDDSWMHDEEGKPLMDDPVEARYVILDENLKAVSFLDYYDFPLIEDLGFGLKVYTDKGCMFVTYELKAITDDNWTDFKLMNDGRIMAIGKKNANTDPDDLNVKDGVVGYFRIPPTE